jgi:hypothetical protein
LAERRQPSEPREPRCAASRSQSKTRATRACRSFSFWRFGVVTARERASIRRRHTSARGYWRRRDRDVGLSAASCSCRRDFLAKWPAEAHSGAPQILPLFRPLGGGDVKGTRRRSELTLHRAVGQQVRVMAAGRARCGVAGSRSARATVSGRVEEKRVAVAELEAWDARGKELGTILLVGPRGPLLQSVTPRGHSLPVGPARCGEWPERKWMLTLETFSVRRRVEKEQRVAKPAAMIGFF